MEAVNLMRRAIRRWLRRDGPGLSAAVSFYAVFAVAPMLVFSVVVSSKALGIERARDSAVSWLSDMVPVNAAESLVSIVQVKFFAGGAWWTDLISGGVLIWAASLVFLRLVVGTRRMTGEPLEEERSRLHRNLVSRGIAILFVIGVGLLVCIVFVGSSLVSPLVKSSPFGTKTLVSIGNALLLAVGAIVLLQIVTSERLRKRSLVAAGTFLFFAFIVGRVLFQVYVANSAITSAYGVASSLVVFLIWTYYLACGYFIGAAVCAEFQAGRGGERSTPDEEAPANEGGSPAPASSVSSEP